MQRAWGGRIPHAFFSDYHPFLSFPHKPPFLNYWVSNHLFYHDKVFWQLPKMLIKTFGEIRRCVETYQIAHLIYLVFPGSQQLRTLIQTNQFDIIIWRHAYDILYLLVQIGPAHQKHLGEIVYREILIGEII